MADQLYYIQDNGIDFRTGHLPNGTQILIFRGISFAIVIRFSFEGDVLGYDSVPIGRTVDIPDPVIDEIFNQLYAESGTIQVRKFAIPEYEIEIRDMPDYLQEYLDFPETFSEEDAPHLEKAIEDWKQRKSFVLIWCKDYEMSAEGEIEST